MAGKTSAIGDFSGGMSSAVFVNEKAYGSFKDLFIKHGRSYRVRCSNGSHHIVLIDTFHNAIELRRSKVERSDLEERVEDNISRFFKIALKQSSGPMTTSSGSTAALRSTDR
jgi:hypothetical protein